MSTGNEDQRAVCHCNITEMFKWAKSPELSSLNLSGDGQMGTIDVTENKPYRR